MKKETKRTNKKAIEDETKSAPPFDEKKVSDNGQEEAEAKKALTAGSITGAFTQSRDKSSVRYLVEAGEVVKDLLLRSNFPSNQTTGGVKVIALAHHLAKCHKYNDKDAEREALYILAGMPSVDGERIKELVKAIIGDNTQISGKGTFTQRMREKAMGTSLPEG